MKNSIQNILLNNLNLKAYSLILGYSVWSIISPHFSIDRTYTVPVCFYPETNSISHAPESIDITLRAPRKELVSIDPETLAVHIQTKNLKAGKQKLTISPESLFLPSSISVVNYSPSHEYITVTKEL